MLKHALLSAETDRAGERQVSARGDSHPGKGATWARATTVGMPCLCGARPAHGEFHSCRKPHPDLPAICTSEICGNDDAPTESLLIS